MKNLVTIVILCTLASCACLQASHAQDPQCVVAQQVINCTEGAIAALLPGLIPAFADLISGNPEQVDWGAVEQRIEKMGLKDGGCLLAALENDFVSKATASPSLTHSKHAMASHLALQTFKAHFSQSDVRFKLKTPDGQVVYR